MASMVEGGWGVFDTGEGLEFLDKTEAGVLPGLDLLVSPDQKPPLPEGVALDGLVPPFAHHLRLQNCFSCNIDLSPNCLTYTRMTGRDYNYSSLETTERDVSALLVPYHLRPPDNGTWVLGWAVVV